MSDRNPTLQDIWRLLGRLNRRVEGFDGRFDGLERQMVALGERMGTLEARVASHVGALKASIEARDFRLDEHGRRLAKIEDSLP